MTYFDLRPWRKILATGSDALEWLDDLVSAGLTGMTSGETRRSLLLTPTGRIRAEFLVTPYEGGYLLVQDPIQPKRIDVLLKPYVLSSDVQLTDQSDVSLFAIPEDNELQLRLDRPDGDPIELDMWRIERGIVRFGVDLDEDSLPQEAAWTRYIDFTKGCFMGQEAMARIQNFGGHPMRVVKAMRATEPVEIESRVIAEKDEVGLVTSAAGTDAIVRLAWRSREAELHTDRGVLLAERS